MTIFGIPIFPQQASTFAKDVDSLYFFILATCAFFAIGVSIAVVVLGIKYHKTHDGQIGARIEGNPPKITTGITTRIIKAKNPGRLTPVKSAGVATPRIVMPRAVSAAVMPR